MAFSDVSGDGWRMAAGRNEGIDFVTHVLGENQSFIRRPSDLLDEGSLERLVEGIGGRRERGT